ncbi:serine hydrolase [Terrimonas rubra]|uniref:Serine hydrolase n=1 Tax=Terrimonas rubra TaxID=1035890 RepID=A0ABW6A630_9BACT
MTWMTSIKQSAWIGIITIVSYGCGAISPNKDETVDSTIFKLPEPLTISKDSLDRYGKAVSDFLDTNLLNKDFNGACLVAVGGNIVYERYVGYRDLRKKDSITDTTSFHLASTSKPLTGTAVLQLVQQNKLSLNDTLGKFFPGFPYPNISVFMLLTHRSGLPDYVHFMGDSKKWDIKTMVTNDLMLQFLYDQQPKPNFSPNRGFSYCNTNFVLLSMIVEKVSGMSFPEYMKQHVFGPLQMLHTYVYTLADSNHATPSFKINREFWPDDHLEGTYGDKNIYSTPKDMLKFDQALYSGQLIRPTLMDSAFTPYSHEKPSIHNYGLGWRLLMLPNGKKVVYHFGRWHGFTPAFARLTDEKATIIILGNKFNRHIYSAGHQLYDIFGDYQQRRSPAKEEQADEPKIAPASKQKTVRKEKPAPKKTATVKTEKKATAKSRTTPPATKKTVKKK